MPSIFLVLTVISGVSFMLALVWVVTEWMKADDWVVEVEEEVSAEIKQIGASGAKPREEGEQKAVA